MAALRPPFLGDSFPSLKRAVTLGRYASLPGTYSPGLSRVIAQMLKLDSRSRPSADMLLKSSDVMAKLQLDETSTSFAQAANADANQALALISTIKVPQQLRKLNSALPKPCYPDVRPNSPTSWTVAEQKVQIQQAQQEQASMKVPRRAAPLPPVPSLPLPSMADATGISGKENSYPMSIGISGKENNYPVPTARSDVSDKSTKQASFAPAPPTVPQGAVADYYSRRPLAPAYPLHPANRANAAPHRNINTDVASDSSAPYKVPGMGYNKAPYRPSLNPVAAEAENLVPAPPSVPSVQYERHQQIQHAPRAPQRLQYQHNRVW